MEGNGSKGQIEGMGRAGDGEAGLRKDTITPRVSYGKQVLRRERVLLVRKVTVPWCCWLCCVLSVFVIPCVVASLWHTGSCVTSKDLPYFY